MSAASQLLVCFALAGEAAPFRHLLKGKEDPPVLVTGMGQVNALKGIQRALAQTQPAGVLTCGLAGGLDPHLAFGTVVCAADDGFSWISSMEKAGMIRTQFFCAEKVITTAHHKSQLWKQHGAGAVDMESAVIRQVCRDRNIPSATVRVISDTAEEDLPLDFNQYLNEACRFNYLRLMADVLLSPSRIGPLLRFQQRTKMAARILARKLHECFSSVVE